MNYKLFFLKDKINYPVFYLDEYIFLNLNFNIFSFDLLKIKPK